MKTKVCSKCGKEKELSEFNKRKQILGGLARNCRECVNEYQRARFHKRRVYHIQKKYNLEWNEYLSMLDAQDHLCAICRVEPLTPYYTHIDHNHDTGEVRGLLCKSCNQGLGHFRESISSLGNAIKYLRSYDE